MDSTSDADDTSEILKMVIDENLIGKGTYGDVYGPFSWRNETCAVKRVVFAAKLLTEGKRKTLEEKRVLWTSQSHENLIKIQTVCLVERGLMAVLYIFMEYLGGDTLRNALDTRRPLPTNVVSDWAKQIANGMSYLHERNIVHRDLKSHNVLLTKNYLSNAYDEITLKIGDFDEMREHYGTATMTLIGTYGWMAPEVLLEERFSKSSDVWSYGVVVWEMLTRDIPHKDLGVAELANKAKSRKLALSIPSSIPGTLCQLLRYCFRLENNDRPSFCYIMDLLSSSTRDDRYLIKRPETTEVPPMSYPGTQNHLYDEQVVMVPKTQDGYPWDSVFVPPVIGENNQLMFLPQLIPRLQNEAQSSSQDYSTTDRYQQNGGRTVNPSLNIQPYYNGYTGKRPHDGLIARKKFRPDYDSEYISGLTHEKNDLMSDEVAVASANVVRSQDHRVNNTVEGQPTQPLSMSYLNLLPLNSEICGLVGPGGPIAFSPGFQGNAEYRNVQTFHDQPGIQMLNTHANNTFPSHMVSTSSYPTFSLLPSAIASLPGLKQHVTPGATPQATKPWQVDVTMGLREHLRHTLVQAIVPTNMQLSLQDRRMQHLVQYARIVENDMYRDANSREEYYLLLAQKIHKIKKDLEQKRMKSLSAQGNGIQMAGHDARNTSVVNQQHDNTADEVGHED